MYVYAREARVRLCKYTRAKRALGYVRVRARSARYSMYVYAREARVRVSRLRLLTFVRGHTQRDLFYYYCCFFFRLVPTQYFLLPEQVSQCIYLIIPRPGIIPNPWQGMGK